MEVRTVHGLDRDLQAQGKRRNFLLASDFQLLAPSPPFVPLLSLGIVAAQAYSESFVSHQDLLPRTIRHLLVAMILPLALVIQPAL